MEYNRKSLKINAILNVIKQACSILFPMIVFPYITRTIGIDCYGRYSFADSIVSYFTVLAMLGVSTYAVRESAGIRNDSKKFNEFASEMLVINGVACFFSLGVLCYFTINVPRIYTERFVIAILTLNVISNVIGRDWINIVYEDYFYITIRYILIHTVSIVFIISAIKGPDDFYKYVFLMALTNSGGYLLNVFYTRKYTRIVRITLNALIRHIKPILTLFFIAVASKIYINSDITILGFLVSDFDVGTYSLSSKVYLLIKGMVNAAMQVAIPRIAMNMQKKKYDEAKDILKGVKQLLIATIIPMVIWVYCMTDKIMLVLCGNKYNTDGGALRTLSWALFFSVFACYYAHLILVPAKKEKIFAVATIISVVVNLMLNIILIPSCGIKGAAISTVLSEMIVLVICRFGVRNFFVKTGIGIKIVSILSGAITFLVCTMIYKFDLSPLFGIATSFALSAIISGILYYLYFMLDKNRTK